MHRLPGLDLARGLAFLGMVIVNYRLVLGWGTLGERNWWLPEFLNQFTSRAAPLFVTIAGVGTTLMFRAARIRRAEGHRTPMGKALLRAALLGLVLGALALCVGYNRWTAEQKEPSLELEQVITGWIEDAPKVTEKLPGRVSAYADALLDGKVDLAPWLLGALAVTLTLVVVLRNDPRGSLIARAMFLAALGYAWFPIWDGDILHWYALFLLSGAALVAMPWWVLATTGLLSLLVGPYWRLVSAWEPRAGWRGFEVPGFWELEDQARNFFYNGWHAFFPWVAFYIAGLLIGRLPLHRLGAPAALLILGCGLWFGGKAAMPNARFALEDRAHATVAATTTTLGHELPDGLSLSLGPASERPFYDEENRPPAGPSVSSSVAVNIDEDEHSALIRSAKRIARALRRVRGRPPFASWNVTVDAHPLADSEGLAIILDVDYGPEMPPPADHLRHRDHVIATVASLMANRGTVGSRFSRGLLRWPRDLPGMFVRRTLNAKTEEPGQTQPIVVDTTWIDVERVRAADDTAATAATLITTSSGPPPSLFFFPVAMGSSLIALSLCLLFGNLTLIQRVLHPVICAGQMALTLYVAHVAVGITTINALGYASDLRTDLPGVATCIVVCWLVSLGFAMWWRSFAKRGPLEAIMRSACG